MGIIIIKLSEHFYNNIRYKLLNVKLILITKYNIIIYKLIMKFKFKMILKWWLIFNFILLNKL